jgi:hypothetical protein
MGLVAEGQVGPRYVQDGSNTELRLGRTGEVVTVDAHARYYEPGYRGKLYSAMTAVAGVTIIAEMVTPVAANKQTVLSVYNPQSSGVNGVLHKVQVIHISGTPGAGNNWSIEATYGERITVTPNNYATSGAMPTPHYPSNTNGQLMAYTALAVGTANAHVLFRVLGLVSFATALAVTTPNLAYVEDLQGEIVIPPGCILTLAPPALGTSHVVVASMSWEEVPI